MEEKKKITSEAIREDRVTISGTKKNKAHQLFMLKPMKRELTLAEQQELTGKVMTVVKKARVEKMRLSWIITTLRDIVTCTDSLLIRAAAYTTAVVLMLCVLSGLFIVFSALTSVTLAQNDVDSSLINPSTWAVTETVVGKIYYLRSMESYILSQT